MMQPSPFHIGEQRVQERLGVREQIEPWARQVVRSHLPEEHRIFHTSLPFLVAAARDEKDRPWATLLTGSPGFVRTPDAGHLEIEAQPPAGDALTRALGPGTDLGLLGIELESRRRNRVNGRIVDSRGRMRVEVRQSFGNCPQYIRQRRLRRVFAATASLPAKRANRLSRRMREWVGTADTFFIASGYQGSDDSPASGMDASHRGGEPGFIRVDSDTQLTFPDYAGNNHFNTIGNLLLDPRAGLLFVDFECGSLLQLTGRTRIDWDSPDLAHFPGARRLISFRIEGVVELPQAVPLRWQHAGDQIRSLRLVEKRRESEDVCSFTFQARDGGALAEFQAGQHLPIELSVPGTAAPIQRTYSLSNGPGNLCYRISVKREPFGLASRYLHDQLETGALINAHLPAGEFVLSDSDRPVALVSAGIGLTPMVSMAHALTEGTTDRRVFFVHQARDLTHHPLAGEIRALAATHPQVRLHVSYSRPPADAELDVAHDSVGRLTAERLLQLVPDADAEFYFCGPSTFMAEMTAELLEHGIPADRIRTETFGSTG